MKSNLLYFTNIYDMLFFPRIFTTIMYTDRM